MNDTTLTPVGQISLKTPPKSEVEPEVEVIELKEDETPEHYILKKDVEAKIEFYGERWKLSKTMKKRMLKTILCENPPLNPKLQSGVIEKDGKREDSWGLSQINLPHWPEITKKQAQDPDFSINFMAQKFSEGKQKLWSCYKQLYK